MRQRLPLILSTAALVVACLSLTGIGQAALSVVPFAKNAGTVNHIKANRLPKKGQLLALGRNKKFPKSVLPITTGPRGATGPRGDTGGRGPAGAPGTAGTAGADGTARAYGVWQQMGTPGQDAARSKNTTITRNGIGDYCVTLPASINVATTTAVLSSDYNTDSGVGITEWDDGVPCTGNAIHVKVGTLAGGNYNAQDITWSIVIP